MNWYSNIKRAALSADWWKQFGHHFQQVLNHFIPGRSTDCRERPGKSEQPLLCSNPFGHGSPILEMFFDNRLALTFHVSYNGFIYKCEIQMLFYKPIASATSYQDGLNAKVDQQFGGKIEHVSIHVYTYKERGKATTLIPSTWDLPPMTPYEIIQRIYTAILGDGGGEDSEMVPDAPVPSNVVEPDLVGV